MCVTCLASRLEHVDTFARPRMEESAQGLRRARAGGTTRMGGSNVRLFGRKRAAAMAVVFAALAAAPVANAAVMQQRPSSSYQANGTVRKIIVVGNTAYLGGDFTAMIPSGGGTAVTSNHAAAVDMTTGNLLPWNHNVNGTV